MELYYRSPPGGNFGDDLNPWLWPQLLPNPLAQCLDDDTLFIGIGSVLNHRIPARPSKKLVFGSGFGYGSPPHVTREWQFVGVRGPLTAKILDLPCSVTLGDSAMLLRHLIAPAAKTEYPVAFMPSCFTAPVDDWQGVCQSLSVLYIPPSAPVKHILAAIRASRLLITESLHGAIVADVLRVPWIAVRTRPGILKFKWDDWAASLGLDYEFEWLPRIWNSSTPSRVKQGLRPLATRAAAERLRWLIRHGRRRLSKDASLEQVMRQLDDAWGRVIRLISAPKQGFN